MKEAMYYEKLQNLKVKCNLCPQNCFIPEGSAGFCRVRQNDEGCLYTTNYGKITSYHMDPIEKKPLFHFYPGGRIFSIGSYGCNLGCGFCQNWEIAHTSPEFVETTIDNLVNIAENERNNIGIAYTYNEPFIWYEFLRDITPRIKKSGLNNVLVTNGYVNGDPLTSILDNIDAMNIDLKGFNDSFYNNICKGTLEPVKKTIESSHNFCHIEITTLIISGINDSIEDIEVMAKWIAEINPDIPWHLSRYFPSYKMELPPTEVQSLKQLREVAKQHLNHVYIGNVHGVDNNTYCPQCKELLIDRSTARGKTHVKKGKCSKCGGKVNIIL